MWWARLRRTACGSSCASSAIRCSLVETVSRFGVPAIFPSNGSVTRRPPSLHGVPRDGSPASHGTTEVLRLPAARPAALRFLRLAVPRMRPPIRSRRLRTPSAVGLDLWSPGAPAGIRSRRSQGSPRFLGNPLVCMPCSHDPGGTLDARPIRRGGCCLPFSPRRRLPDIQSLGAQLPRPAHSLSTLRSAGCPLAPRKTRFRWGATLYRVGFGPTGSTTKGFRFLSIAFSFLPSQAYPGARGVSTGRCCRCER